MVSIRVSSATSTATDPQFHLSRARAASLPPILPQPLDGGFHFSTVAVGGFLPRAPRHAAGEPLHARQEPPESRRSIEGGCLYGSGPFVASWAILGTF